MTAEILTRVIRDALLTRDERRIRLLARHYNIPIPSKPVPFWAHVNRCILNMEDAPEGAKMEARAWLRKRGLEV